ncbi:protein translocase subunit SecF, partial [Patescibacteria group bacterium]|nr:protein translocase subunit SecF [Patescibacteria group bacterium]
MNFISKSKIFLGISAALVLLSILALLIWGLKPGVDFTGGSLMRIEFTENKLANDQIQEIFSSDQEKFGQVQIQPVGQKEVILKFKNIDEAAHQELLKKIKEKTRAFFSTPPETQKELVQEVKFESIGPSIGQELKRKSILAVIIVISCIIAYIAWAFRAVSNQLNKYESVRYGLIAIIALVHDIIITLGVFSFLGRFLNVEIDTFFIAALLTILGYSVNDTIIIFDRIRENIG